MQQPVPREIAAVLKEHAAANRESAVNWERYTHHREQMMAAIAAIDAPADRRVTLLGAGCCNDVELDVLARTSSEVLLVDADAAAIAQARGRLDAGVRTRVTLCAPLDLAGIAEEVIAWRRHPPSPIVIQNAVDRAAGTIAAKLPPAADVVVSCCVLTQIGWTADRLLGPEHPAWTITTLALLTVHLRTLAHATRAGGTALLVTDVCSSALHPIDPRGRSPEPARLLDELVDKQIVYAIANPVLIRRTLRLDRRLRRSFATQTSLAPWVWVGPGGLDYLVLPLRLERAANA